MARTASSFARKSAKYKIQAKVLIICEDQKSSLTYIGEASRHFRAHAEVEVAHCGRTDPQGIVGEAIKRQGKYDKVYCVIDRDGHHLFHEALAMAEHHEKVVVIPSYPCYEYWLLLHFQKSRKPYVAIAADSACDQLVRDLKKNVAMLTYAKGLDGGLFAHLRDQLPVARKHAAQVLAEAENDGNFNPSTKIHLLMNALEALGIPQPA